MADKLEYPVSIPSIDLFLRSFSILLMSAISVLRHCYNDIESLAGLQQLGYCKVREKDGLLDDDCLWTSTSLPILIHLEPKIKTQGVDSGLDRATVRGCLSWSGRFECISERRLSRMIRGPF